MGHRLAGTRWLIQHGMNQRTSELLSGVFCESPDHRTVETQAFHVLVPQNCKSSESWNQRLQGSLGQRISG